MDLMQVKPWPAHRLAAGGHVGDLLAEDHFQHRDALGITDVAQALDQARRHVEAAGLEHARHQGHACQRAVRGFLGHFPQAVAGVEIAIAVTELGHARGEQAEVPGLVIGDAHEVGGEFLWKFAEAVHRIPGEVDGVQLDVGNGVQEGRTASWVDRS